MSPNPFDSDDESIPPRPARLSSNPFDEEDGNEDGGGVGSCAAAAAAPRAVSRASNLHTSKKGSDVIPSGSNPFDDSDEDRGGGGCAAAPRAVSRASNLPVAKGSKVIPSGTNPFDDSDEEDGSGNAAATPPRAVSRASNLQAAKGSKVIPSGTNPFDDSDYDGDGLLQPQSQKHATNTLNEGTPASEKSTLKKVGVLVRGTGTRHATKLVGGAMTQAQKLKGSAGRVLGAGSTNNKDMAAVGSGRKDDEKMYEVSYCQDKAPRRYEDDRFRKQDLQYRDVEELEGCALQKSGDVTSSLQNCLRVAGEMQEGATKTLLGLHGQREQIKRTHEVTVDMSEDLTRSEKVIGTLGGIFSRKWKPKKSQPIVGPVATSDASLQRRVQHLEQRVALGLHTGSQTNPRLNQVTPNPAAGELMTTQQKLDAERIKQDDTLTKLSDVLDNLKGLSIDMGSEISSQMDAMDQLDKDAAILNDRIKNANRRGQRLLRR